jgi:hypothetical protein
LVTLEGMAMVLVVVVLRAWMVVVGICVMLPVFGRAEYNCSMVPVPTNTMDFFTFLRSTCQTLQQGTGKTPQHSMHVTSINPKTNQTLEVWADCSLNQDETFCEVRREVVRMKLSNKMSLFFCFRLQCWRPSR